jgi:hypothetical protein
MIPPAEQPDHAPDLHPDFIRRLYSLILHRSADPAGLAHWINHLCKDNDPAALLDAFMASYECRTMRPGGLPANLEIIVPVCNAERWIGVILSAYQTLGIDPLFILDARSSDQTLNLLLAGDARIMIASGTHPSVESLLYNAIPKLRSPWILRFDDDEIPSPALLDWVRENINTLAAPSACFARQAIWHLPESGWVTGFCEAACRTIGGPESQDRQHRLFLRRDVVLTEALHTAGFTLAATVDAPASALIYHIDWLIRSHAQRLRKLENYERQAPGNGLCRAPYYLPEDYAPDFYDFVPLNDPFAEAIVKNLPARIIAVPQT